MFDDLSIPGAESIRTLDKYHFTQAVHHIFMNDFIEKLSIGYILHNWSSFKLLIQFMKELRPVRIDAIDTKVRYIKNNLYSIWHLYEHNISCPMESQINYILAKQLTQPPKGSSFTTLEKLLEIIIRCNNKEDLRQLYLYKYYNRDHEVINEDRNYKLSINEKTHRTLTIIGNRMKSVERRIA